MRDIIIKKEFEKAKSGDKEPKSLLFKHYYKAYSELSELNEGIPNIAEEYADDKGCSLVFLNSKKGELIFELAKKSLDLKYVNMSKFLFQQPLHKAYKVDLEKRQKFWTEFFENSDHIFEKYGR